MSELFDIWNLQRKKPGKKPPGTVSSYRDSIDFHISVERGPKVVVSVLVRTGPGYHTRVHEGGHGEVHQDEQGENALEDGHRVPVLGQHVPADTGEGEE